MSFNLPDPREAVFILDPEAGLTDGNLWRDSGPHGLHVTPVNYVAPAYGIAVGPSGASYIGFDGATQRGTLPLDFYRWTPTNAVTAIAAFRCPTPAVSDRIFDCTDANNGIRLNVDPAAAERIRLTAMVGGVACYATATANIPLTGRTRVVVASVRVSNTMASGRAVWVDGVQIAATAAGTAAALAYTTTVVPTVGSVVGGGGNFFDDLLYYLALWPRIFSHAEAQAITAMLRDRM